MSVQIDEAEKVGLETHVVACGQRYQALHDKAEETRRRTWRIELYAVVVLANIIKTVVSDGNDGLGSTDKILMGNVFAGIGKLRSRHRTPSATVVDAHNVKN